jgi:hypothetical protein
MVGDPVSPSGTTRDPLDPSSLVPSLLTIVGPAVKYCAIFGHKKADSLLPDGWRRPPVVHWNVSNRRSMDVGFDFMG